MKVIVAYLVTLTEKSMTKPHLLGIILTFILLQKGFGQDELTSGRVTYYTSDQIYCDMGKNQFLQVGDTLDIMRRSETMGTIVVSHLSSKSSVSDIFIQHEPIKLGDLVIPRRKMSRPEDIQVQSDSVAAIASVKQNEPKIKQIFSHHGTFSIRYNFNQITNRHRLNESLHYSGSIHKLKLTVYGRSNSSTGEFNLYQAKGDWGKKSDKYYIQFGRVFSPEFSGIGATDGLFYQWKTNENYTLGGLLGFQPEINQWIPSSQIKKIGLFTSKKTTLSNLKLTGTMSLIGQYANDIVDREYSFIKVQGFFKSKLSFRTMAIIDYYRTELADRSGVNLTSFQSTFQYKFNNSFMFHSRLSQKVRPYYRTQFDSKQDSIISNESVSGWNNSFRITQPRLGVFQFGGNIRKQSSKNYAYLGQFQFRSVPVKYVSSIGYESNWIQNDLIKGFQNAIIIQKDFEKSSRLFLEYELFQYGYGTTPFDYAQQSLSFTYSKRIWKLYSYSTVDFTLDETSTSTIYTFVGLSYRF